jgi:hypothetical protein
MKELLALSSLYITALENLAAVAGRSLMQHVATLLNTSDLMLTAAACAH